MSPPLYHLYFGESNLGLPGICYDRNGVFQILLLPAIKCYFSSSSETPVCLTESATHLGDSFTPQLSANWAPPIPPLTPYDSTGLYATGDVTFPRNPVGDNWFLQRGIEMAR